MKQIILVLIAYGSVVVAAPKETGGTFLSSQTYMSLQVAKKRWKQEDFDAASFKVGDSKKRASMAVSLISSKRFLGKSPEEVRTALGSFSGFFWSDYIPAYIIDEGWTQKKDTWQLIFLLNDEGQVNEVKIHKNCCN